MEAIISLLAQAEAAAPPLGPDGVPVELAPQTAPEHMFSQLPIDDIWGFIGGISWLHALLFVATGLIYIIYGWRLFKALVVINFAAFGLFVGIFVGRQVGSLGSPIWGGIFGTFLVAAGSYFLMKYAVAVLGALAGAVLGGALWRSITLPDQLIWCGALAGLIAGGFLAFASYRVSIMLFSSLQGSMAVAIGSLALLNSYPNLSVHLAQAVYSNTFLLPLAVLIPTVGGIWCQRRLLRSENEWAMPE